MEIKVKKNHFLKGLSKVENIISVREIRSAISNVLIEAKDDNVTLTASDFEITISTIMPAEIIKTGTIAIPARKLNQIISELQAEDISLSVTENNNIKINSASKETNSRFSIMGFSAEDYPVMPSIPNDNYKEIPKDIVIEMFNHVAYAMAKEDARYVFNGLYIMPEGKVCNFIATDGRRLSLIRKEFPLETPIIEEAIILPHKTVREIQKLSDEDGDLSLAYDKLDKRPYFKLGNTTITSKLIDGNFPDHKQVIPQRIEHNILINKEAFENCIRQVAVMATEPTRQIRFNFEKNRLYLHASTPDLGEADNNLEIDYDSEEKIETAFNSRYIMDVLKVVETENIVFGISSSASPASIQKPGDKDFMAIIMPMKI